MMTPSELAALPATMDHVERAREAVRADPAKHEALEVLLASNPTRGQMVDFIGETHSEFESKVASAEFEQRLAAICKIAGIDEPTSAQRLMAMNIGLLQDQNTILQSGINRALKNMKADSEFDQSNGYFTALMNISIIRIMLGRRN